MFVRPVSEKSFKQLRFSLTDDVFLGADTVEELYEIRDIVEGGLGKGGFRFKEWKFSKIQDGCVEFGKEEGNSQYLGLKH